MLYQYLANNSARFLCNKYLKLCIVKINYSLFSQISFPRSQSHYQLHSFYNNPVIKYFPCVPSIIKQYSTNGQLCWKCSSEKMYEYFCEQCKVIQPLDKQLNYFEILGLKNSFSVDRKEITMRYRKLQNLFHPDKYSVKSEKEQQLAAEHSSFVNKAYNILLDPISRGEYMLLIAGQSIEEGELTMDPEFLMDIMEVNEKLADAEEKETVQEISEKNNAIMGGLLREAEEAFESNNITAARGIVAKLKYYKNIYEKVKDYETKHGIVH